MYLTASQSRLSVQMFRALTSMKIHQATKVVSALIDNGKTFDGEDPGLAWCSTCTLCTVRAYVGLHANNRDAPTLQLFLPLKTPPPPTPTNTPFSNGPPHAPMAPPSPSLRRLRARNGPALGRTAASSLCAPASDHRAGRTVVTAAPLRARRRRERDAPAGQGLARGLPERGR